MKLLCDFSQEDFAMNFEVSDAFLNRFKTLSGLSFKQ